MVSEKEEPTCERPPSEQQNRKPRGHATDKMGDDNTTDGAPSGTEGAGTETAPTATTASTSQQQLQQVSGVPPVQDRHSEYESMKNILRSLRARISRKCNEAMTIA